MIDTFILVVVSNLLFITILTSLPHINIPPISEIIMSSKVLKKKLSTVGWSRYINQCHHFVFQFSSHKYISPFLITDFFDDHTSSTPMAK